MTSTSSPVGQTKAANIDNVLKRLEASVKEGKYYDAQQMYKTLYHRYSGQQKYQDVKNLLISGAYTMLQYGQYNQGSELGLLLLETYNKTRTKPTSENFGPILNIFALFPDQNTEAKAAKETMMKEAIRWSIEQGDNKFGTPELHTAFAISYQRQKEFGKSLKHFVKGNDPKQFANMLAEWSSETYPGERDLLISRAVLQYLCLSNLKDAIVVYDVSMSLVSSLAKSPTPLINYIRFLLLTLQRDAVPLFEMLRKKYKPSIERDPDFQIYLDHIALVFYNVQPPKGMGNVFENLLKSFMGGP